MERPDKTPGLNEARVLRQIKYRLHDSLAPHSLFYSVLLSPTTASFFWPGFTSSKLITSSCQRHPRSPPLAADRSVTGFKRQHQSGLWQETPNRLVNFLSVLKCETHRSLFTSCGESAILRRAVKKLICSDFLPKSESDQILEPWTLHILLFKLHKINDLFI